MQAEKLYTEKVLRTLIERIEHECRPLGCQRCPALMILYTALESVEACTAAECSAQLNLS